MEKNVVKVAVENISYSADILYEYLVPSEFLGKIQVGVRVLVPFGFGNKKRQAIVLETAISSGSNKIKKVWAVLDKAPLLSEEMLCLAKIMKKKYYCTFFDSVKCMLPPGINYKVKDCYKVNEDLFNQKLNELSNTQIAVINFIKSSKKPQSSGNIIKSVDGSNSKILKDLISLGVLINIEKYNRKINDAKIRKIKIAKDLEDIKLTQKQKAVCNILSEKGELSLKELCYFSGSGVGVVNTLIKKDILEIIDEVCYRDPGSRYCMKIEKEQINLTSEQNDAYDNLLRQYKEKKYGVSLLYGVTGSGKTSVFMKLIDQVYKENKEVIVMVPEIALTPQLTQLFKSRYGSEVAIFHSGLSEGERLDEFKRVKNGEIKIAVGTRTAVFAPFENLGLVIIDEEHESTYKSDASPSFHARDIAKFRCHYHNTLLVLSSATPSIESFYMAQKNCYTLNKITKRYGQAKLPKVTVIDMNDELEKGNISNFSSALMEKISNNINSKKQTILLFNRRGYNTFVSCRNCKEVITCPNCSISMTYHSANDRLMCHYCGLSLKLSHECPNCHERQLKFSGCGTQKVEDELQQLLPSAKILRMDADTTNCKFSYEDMLKEFAKGNYDILIGTQMVAKGLNFPNVTLVGIINADQALYGQDFKSYERAFSLMTQVIGRSGRAENVGEAVIQTFTPENPIIQLSAEQDYESFYSSEIELRKAMLYPPFVNVCVVGFYALKEEKASLSARFFFNCLKDLVENKYKNIPLRVLGPSPASVVKVDNKYRYKIIIKFKDNKDFREMLDLLAEKMSKEKIFSSVKMFIDINPDRII